MRGASTVQFIKIFIILILSGCIGKSYGQYQDIINVQIGDTIADYKNCVVHIQLSGKDIPEQKMLNQMRRQELM
jgi:hypothetical protein